MTSLKYILLGTAATATAFAYTAMADHPHKPKKQSPKTIKLMTLTVLMTKTMKNGT